MRQARSPSTATRRHRAAARVGALAASGVTPTHGLTRPKLQALLHPEIGQNPPRARHADPSRWLSRRGRPSPSTIGSSTTLLRFRARQPASRAPHSIGGSLGGRRPRTGDDDDDTRARSIGHPGPMGPGSGVSASGGPGRAATGWTLDRTPSCRQMDPHAHPDQSQPIDRVRAVRMDGRISDLISSHFTPGARHPPRVRSFVPSQTARDQGYSATYWAHQPGLHPRGAH